MELTYCNSTFSGPVEGKVLPKPPQVNTLETGMPPTGCDSIMTPQCIAGAYLRRLRIVEVRRTNRLRVALYNITEPKYATPGNELGIFEEGDYCEFV